MTVGGKYPEDWTLRDWVTHAFQGIKRYGEIPLAVMIANVHRELSEAWEESARGKPLKEIYFSQPTNGDPPNKPEGFVVELADVIIWIFHFCRKYGLPLEEAIWLKMRYNAQRPEIKTKGT